MSSAPDDPAPCYRVLQNLLVLSPYLFPLRLEPLGLLPVSTRKV
jgi:hypothetical protein